MSKRKWHHPDLPADAQKVNSWKSLGEREGSVAAQTALEREFPSSAAQMKDEEDKEMSRRSFVQLMGASSALAGIGLASCRRPETYIVPFANAPEWIIPGKPLYYASSMPSAAGAIPLVVTTYEGRPTKVEPNTLHPDSAGTDSFTQASVLNMYSPDRSKQPLRKGEKATLEDIQKALAKVDKSSTAVLVGNDESPSRTRLLKEAGVKVFTYEATAGELLDANWKLVADFKKADRVLALDCDFVGLDSIGPVRPFFDRRKVEGADYKTKKADPSKMNRLYSAETSYTLTGGMADHRLRLKPSEILPALAFIAKQLGVATGSIVADFDTDKTKWLSECAKDLKSAVGHSIVTVGSRYPEAAQRLALAINDKLGNVGAGKPLNWVSRDTASAGSLVDLCAAIDDGQVKTVILTTPSNPIFDAPADLKFADKLKKVESFQLGERVNHTARAVDWHIPAAHYLESWSDARSATGVYTLVQPLILPLYGGVSELEVIAALLDSKVVFAQQTEELPSSAYLAVRKTFEALVEKGEKAWSEALKNGFAKTKAASGTAPASDSAKLTAALGKLAPVKKGALELVFATDYSVLDGRYADNGWLQEMPDPISKVTWDNAALISPQTAKDLGIFEKVIKLENKYGKSQYKGEVEGESFVAPIIRIYANGTNIEIPVLIAFGQADGVVVLPVGYGQSFYEPMRKRDFDDFNADVHAPKLGFETGLVSRNAGFDVYPLRSKDTAFTGVVSKIEVLDNTYKLSLVQEHHSMYGRALAREVSTMPDEKGHDFDYQVGHVKKQGMDSHAPENISLYKPEGSSEWWKGGKKVEPLLNDDVFQWAMAIDLNVCTGCNACLVACQSENNIPIVGKEQVAMGREMHWIRMDRYFAATAKRDKDGNTIDDGHGHPVLDEENPEMIAQPVGCVQCESAPCETVCPVNATVHTEDGLNAMAYNRCIGTRYCANNCPYKARRFNFFDYNKRNPLLDKNLYKGPLGKKQEGDAKHLQKNPNVTVRMRGVMEKCTYCVQRLKSARIKAKGVRKDKVLAGTATKDIEVKPSELRAPVDSVKVACQEACPSGAITFGNLLHGDKETVVRAKNSERNYDLLQYIGTRPRTSYLARVKNPNPHMPGAASVGTATIHMH